MKCGSQELNIALFTAFHSMVLILERSIGSFAHRDQLSLPLTFMTPDDSKQLYESYVFSTTTEHDQVARLWRTVHSAEASTFQRVLAG